MRIGLLDCAVELDPPPPPLAVPRHAASSMAAAATVGANQPSLLIALLLTPLQTFAAIDCDRSGRSRVLSSANARRGGRPAGKKRRRRPPLTRLPLPIGKAF